MGPTTGESNVSHWNFRIVKSLHQHGGETLYSIHECYYADDGTIGWTENPVAVTGDTPEDIRWTLEKMAQALDRPVIEDI
jgi:hypothetical protein